MPSLPFTNKSLVIAAKNYEETDKDFLFFPYLLDFKEHWLSGQGAWFPIQGSRVENQWVVPRSTQPFILPRLIKWVPGISGDLVVKSKLSPCSGSFVFNYLAAPGPTLGHSRGDRLTNLILITVFYLFQPEPSRIVVAFSRLTIFLKKLHHRPLTRS